MKIVVVVFFNFFIVEVKKLIHLTPFLCNDSIKTKCNLNTFNDNTNFLDMKQKIMAKMCFTELAYKMQNNFFNSAKKSSKIVLFTIQILKPKVFDIIIVIITCKLREGCSVLQCKLGIFQDDQGLSRYEADDLTTEHH